MLPNIYYKDLQRGKGIFLQWDDEDLIELFGLIADLSWVYNKQSTGFMNLSALLLRRKTLLLSDLTQAFHIQDK